MFADAYPCSTIERIFSQFMKASADDSFHGVSRLGSKIIAHEASWCRLQVKGVLDGAVKAGSLEATERVGFIFSRAEKAEKAALVSILENVYAATTPVMKTWFSIGYLGEVARLLRRSDVKSKTFRKISWAASAVMVSTTLSASIEHVISPIAHLAEHSVVDDAPLNLIAMQEWGQTILARVRDEQL